MKHIVPEPRDEMDLDEVYGDGEVILVPLISTKNISQRWPVIVETWDRKKYGRGKREYLRTFNEAERKVISRYYTKIYRWYLVRGFPDRIGIKMSTFNLINRAADFFATI